MTMAKAAVIATEDESAPAIHERLELLACSCGAKMTVARNTRHDENLGRLYAMCTQCGATKGRFLWLMCMECVLHERESCRTGPMKYWFQEEKQMFFYRRKDLGDAEKNAKLIMPQSPGIKTMLNVALCTRIQRNHINNSPIALLQCPVWTLFTFLLQVSR